MAELLLLGSGSADGWPNPWCRCPSCQWARETGTLRARTSALLDKRILIDPGPDLTTRAGLDLAAVELVLVTHSHPDHFDPSFLLARSWAVAGTSPGPLVLAGPATVLAAAREWVGPDSPVRFCELVAGSNLTAAGWQIRALPAAHNLAGTDSYDATALLYEFTHRHGRLLWATDTAAVPHEDLRGQYDLVALELTFGDKVDHGSAHLDLPSFAEQIAQLAARGRLAAHAQVVAVHLSHHNPPDLPERLAPLGAIAGMDVTVVAGTDLTVYRLPNRRAPAGTLADPLPAAGQLTQRPEVPKRVFLTGGARSGKSSRAEALASELETAAGLQVTYVATAPYPTGDLGPTGNLDPTGDQEWAARVRAHQTRRPAHWRTHETGDLVAELARATASELLLIDCLTLWLTRAIDDARAWDEPDRAHIVADQAVSAVLAQLEQATCAVIMVSNEVGSGIVPATPSGRLFQDLLGRANSRIAAACQQVELLVAGHPILLRGP